MKFHKYKNIASHCLQTNNRNHVSIRKCLIVRKKSALLPHYASNSERDKIHPCDQSKLISYITEIVIYNEIPKWNNYSTKRNIFDTMKKRAIEKRKKEKKLILSETHNLKKRRRVSKKKIVKSKCAITGVMRILH